ncbi:hypothetical protein RvY_18220 [Ramazzottius varieornatus]|uniref:Uncharacterized protein n=1 Tax=Ramazzottius varieornatus TaxID=947166 RepID=A0A1D1W4Y8_RAMVA|nr:hypothetical protein RvY_18220 [Ramazzottius varieornatus]
MNIQIWPELWKMKVAKGLRWRRPQTPGRRSARMLYGALEVGRHHRRAFVAAHFPVKGISTIIHTLGAAGTIHKSLAVWAAMQRRQLGASAGRWHMLLRLTGTNQLPPLNCRHCMPC